MSTDSADGRYLIRFDDICPTMNWTVWDVIESHLVRRSIRPILAVVPDNRDPKLIVDGARPDFWERVRSWQEAGYAIAAHGYQHRYVNKNAGLMRLNPQSEFAGLPRNAQEAKLRAGLEIFAKYGVRADAWVAPAHSFDRTTVDVLADLGVSVISDGLWPWPLPMLAVSLGCHNSFGVLLRSRQEYGRFAVITTTGHQARSRSSSRTSIRMRRRLRIWRP